MHQASTHTCSQKRSFKAMRCLTAWNYISTAYTPSHLNTRTMRPLSVCTSKPVLAIPPILEAVLAQPLPVLLQCLLRGLHSHQCLWGVPCCPLHSQICAGTITLSAAAASSLWVTQSPMCAGGTWLPATQPSLCWALACSATPSSPFSCLWQLPASPCMWCWPVHASWERARESYSPPCSTCRASGCLPTGAPSPTPSSSQVLCLSL